MRKRKTWIINQYTSTPKLGGGGNRSYHIAFELKKKGHDVTLITASYSHVPKRNVEVSETFHFDQEKGINLIIIKNIVYESGKSIKRILSMLIFWLKLYRLPLKKLKSPDFIIVSSISLLPILNAFYFKRKFKNKPKVILEIRDIWPLSLIELGNFSRFNPFVIFLAWIEKRGYQKSDYLTSVLPLAYQHFDKIAGRKVRFKHISNGIHLESIKDIADLEKSIVKQIPTDKFIVGYTGALGEANAMEYFVEAAKLSTDPSIYFIIVGDGYKLPNLKTRAEGLENFLFLPRIPKNQVQSILKKFDLLFLGSRKTPLYRYGVSANKIFDYMFSGKPILMTGKVPENEIELANCGLMIKPDDPKEILHAIMRFYTMNEEERIAFGKRGKDFVLQNRTYHSFANTYLEIFKEIENKN